MIPTIKSSTEDAKNTPSAQDISWSKQAVAFARIMSLQMGEWTRLKCHWLVTTLTGHEDKRVLVAYFYVDGYELGKEDGEITLNGHKLIDIVIATATKKSATATEKEGTEG